jgi:hypothetical protein
MKVISLILAMALAATLIQMAQNGYGEYLGSTYRFVGTSTPSPTPMSRATRIPQR